MRVRNPISLTLTILTALCWAMVPTALADQHQDAEAAPASEAPDPASGTTSGAADEALAEEEAKGAAVISAEGADAGGEETGITISLAQAIDNALANNLDLRLSRYVPEIALEQLGEAEGIYDPNFFADFGYTSSNVPTTFSLGGQEELGVTKGSLTSGQTGMEGEIPKFGARYGIRYAGARDATSGTSFAALSPEYTAGVEATLSIPLLRDLIWNSSWTQIQSRKLDHSATREDFRREMMDLVRDTEEAYWSLIAAEEQLGVAEKSLETSEALREQTQAQFDVGTVSKVDVIEADAGVAERELNVIVVENAYRASQDRLIDLITGGQQLTAPMDLEIDTTDPLGGIEVRTVNVQESMDQANAKRPELASANYSIEQREVQLKFAKNQRLPSLNVEGSYGYRGISGTKRDGTDLGGYPEAHDDFDPDGNPNWSTRGTFAIPLGNRQAKHREAQSNIELRRSHTQLARLKQNIVLEVRNAVRNLHSAEKGINASERRADAAAEQLRAEQIRLKYGDSTPFDVLQRERDFVDAESQRISSYELYRTSLAELERSQGTILQSHNIQIDDEENRIDDEEVVQ